MRRFRGVIVVALVAVACNGSPGEGEPSPTPAPEPTASTGVVSSDSFVDGLCTAMGDWIGVLQGGNADLQQSLTGASPEEVLEVLGGYLDSTVAATDELIADVEALGSPDVDGGEEARDAIIEAFQGVRTALADAADEVAGLDAADPQALAEALTQVSSDLTSATGDLVGPLARTPIPELEQAYADSEACNVVKSLGE